MNRDRDEPPSCNFADWQDDQALAKRLAELIPTILNERSIEVAVMTQKTGADRASAKNLFRSRCGDASHEHELFVVQQWPRMVSTERTE